MHILSKLCDAADWCQPELHSIITNELRELPRFHRKQWEFAMILHALRRLGRLHNRSMGLSMGGGRERLLYALAANVQQLVVTDLYETATTWECARTDDPETFVMSDPPLPVEPSSLKVLRMDMRDLSFPDSTFDFCYSSCSIEHIGTRNDFLRHFNEVARVLKDDGVYVMTTEIGYGDITIPDHNNYVFSLTDLISLLDESDLLREDVFDARILQHEINKPHPGAIADIVSLDAHRLGRRLLQNVPHIQLMRGKYPFTSGLFILRKKKRGQPPGAHVATGMEHSRQFMQQAVDELRSSFETSTAVLDPFTWLRHARSYFVADHRQFLSEVEQPDAETVFHTDYFWWGTGTRVFEVTMVPDPSVRSSAVLELRVHRYRTLASHNVECVQKQLVQVDSTGGRPHSIEVAVDEDHCYAFLGKVVQGTCTLSSIEVKTSGATRRSGSVPSFSLAETTMGF